jgi:glycosyltransferase involved in cell wall biosynthesis
MFVRSSDAWLSYGTKSSADLLRLGADPARIVIAPLVARSAPARARTTRRRRYAGESFRYLFVGRLIERKGVDVLLDAFNQTEGGELWIAGDGPLSGLATTTASIDHRVSLLGHADAIALDALYGRADALILPSHYDAWGLVVNEAQAYGLPVIATDQVGAAADLIEPGVNGLVVPAGSSAALARAMKELAQWTPEQRERCAELCQAKLREHSLERAEGAMIEACALALEHRKRRRPWPRRRQAHR